jgi:hypothetical protein
LRNKTPEVNPRSGFTTVAPMREVCALRKLPKQLPQRGNCSHSVIFFMFLQWSTRLPPVQTKGIVLTASIVLPDVTMPFLYPVIYALRFDLDIILF